MSTKKPAEYSAVIYRDVEDEVWIAHSLYTDQVGTGNRVVDALADLILAVEQVAELARKDPEIRLFRKAPKDVFAMLKSARHLPHEVFEVAYRKVHNQWPEDVVIDVASDERKPPRFKTHMDPLVGA